MGKSARAGRNVESQMDGSKVKIAEESTSAALRTKAKSQSVLHGLAF
jgi:hypothetical protein